MSLRAVVLTAALCLVSSVALASPKVDGKGLIDKKGTLSADEITQLVKRYGEANAYPDDVKALAFLKSTQNGEEVQREAVMATRDRGTYQFLMLLTKPKTQAGDGYLRLDNNLWSYDAKEGRWERRTNRERLAGTDVVEGDLDTSWQSSYTAKDDGMVTSNGVTMRKVTFTARPGFEIAFPIRTMWIDMNLIARKVQDFAESGKLLRTMYAPKWTPLMCKSKGHEVWYPKELRIEDEVEKGRSTVLLVQQVDVRGLPDNTFTKAWLEGQSR